MAARVEYLLPLGVSEVQMTLIPLPLTFQHGLSHGLSLKPTAAEPALELFAKQSVQNDWELPEHAQLQCEGNDSMNAEPMQEQLASANEGRVLQTCWQTHLPQPADDLRSGRVVAGKWMDALVVHQKHMEPGCLSSLQPSGAI